MTAESSASGSSETGPRVPACPAGPERTVAVVRNTWRIGVDTDRYGSALRRRATAMIAKRLAGDPTGAAVAGWMSLAGLLVGAGAGQIADLARADDLDPPTVARTIGLTIPDAAGLELVAWLVCERAAAGAEATTLIVDGRYESGRAVCNRIREGLADPIRVSDGAR